MIRERHIAERDYSGLFVGVILLGVVAIVFVLMVAFSQFRARAAPMQPLAVRPPATQIQH